MTDPPQSEASDYQNIYTYHPWHFSHPHFCAVLKASPQTTGKTKKSNKPTPYLGLPCIYWRKLQSLCFWLYAFHWSFNCLASLLHTKTYLLSIELFNYTVFYIPLNVAATCHVLIQCLKSSRSLQITKTHGLFYGKWVEKMKSSARVAAPVLKGSLDNLRIEKI